MCTHLLNESKLCLTHKGKPNSKVSRLELYGLYQVLSKTNQVISNGWYCRVSTNVTGEIGDQSTWQTPIP